MAEILVFKTSAISEPVRQALIDAGIVPVEVDDPSTVRLISVEGPELGGGDLLYAALKGCMQSDYAKQAFAEEAMRLLEKRRAKAEAAESPKQVMPARDSKGRFLPTAQP